MVSLSTVTSSNVSLPIIGSVSVITAGAIILGAYFLLFKGRRVSSRTTRVTYRR